MNRRSGSRYSARMRSGPRLLAFEKLLTPVSKRLRMHGGILSALGSRLSAHGLRAQARRTENDSVGLEMSPSRAESPEPPMREFTHSLTIEAPPAAVLDAFFDADALAAWWRVKRSLCVPRPLGVLRRGMGADRVAGRNLRPARRRVSRNGDRVQARTRVLSRRSVLAAARRRSGRSDGARGDVHAAGNSTVLHVRQSGWEDSTRWSRYYELIATGFTVALEEMKNSRRAHSGRTELARVRSRRLHAAAVSRSSSAPCASSFDTLTNTIDRPGLEHVAREQLVADAAGRRG